MQIWRCGSGEALTCGSVEMRKRGSVEVWKRGSVEVWKCRSVEVWKCGSVEVWTEEAKTGKSHRKRKNRDKAPLRYVPRICACGCGGVGGIEEEVSLAVITGRQTHTHTMKQHCSLALWSMVLKRKSCTTAFW